MIASDEIAAALAQQPRVVLQQDITPLERADRLGAELSLELYVKRDDLTSLAFGGNKVRQLEYYFGAARAAQADCVLITGAVQSNFMRLASAAAVKLGMAAYIQLEERVPKNDPIYMASGNVLLDDLLGASRRTYPEGEDEAGADAALGDLAADLRSQGRRPYIIPLSPGHPPLGALGYVHAALELDGQSRAAGMEFDAIVVPSGSGYTHGDFCSGIALSDMTFRFMASASAATPRRNDPEFWPTAAISPTCWGCKTRWRRPISGFSMRYWPPATANSTTRCSKRFAWRLGARR